MFYRNKLSFFTKTKNFSNLFLSILFILTFLLVFFNKTDYFIVNKVKSFSIDVITPAVGFINFLLDANYMFVCKPPNVNSYFFIGEWPTYLLWLELIYFIYALILCLPFKLASLRKK